MTNIFASRFLTPFLCDYHLPAGRLQYSHSYSWTIDGFRESQLCEVRRD